MLDQELVVELQDVGRIVESADHRDIARHQGPRSATSARRCTPLVDRGAPAAELQDRLQTVQSFSTHASCSWRSSIGTAASLAASTAAGPARGSHPRRDRVQPRRQAVRVGGASSRTIYKRQVIYVSLPLRLANGPVVGVIAAWFDLQAELSNTGRGPPGSTRAATPWWWTARARSSRTRTGRAPQRGCVVVPGRAAGARVR